MSLSKSSEGGFHGWHVTELEHNSSRTNFLRTNIEQVISGIGCCASICFTHHPSSISHRSSVYHSSFIIHRSSLIPHFSSRIVHLSSIITHRSSGIVQQSSFTTYRSSLLVHHSSFVTHHSHGCSARFMMWIDLASAHGGIAGAWDVASRYADGSHDWWDSTIIGHHLSFIPPRSSFMGVQLDSWCE